VNFSISSSYEVSVSAKPVSANFGLSDYSYNVSMAG
jgi:hypothetical protein